MYKQEERRTIEKKFRKVVKKNPAEMEAIIKKVVQILKDPHHYKPLSNVMKNQFRTQIGSFVLVFEIDENQKVVTLLDYDHHDNIYKKKRRTS